jgi:prepilin-type N-terminal cleavage/methylation domain-containing protein
MTLIELIVVLAIFGILSLVSIFNYNGFQSKVDVTNLADDIALQVVQAQNSSLSGLLPPNGQTPTTVPVSAWKPSYGAYFSSTIAADSSGADNKHFMYFVDLGNNNQFDGSTCPSSTAECLNKYTVTNNNSISSITVFCLAGAPTCTAGAINNVTITFARPNSGAVFYSGAVLSGVSYVEIAIHNKQGNISSTIDLYPSGRVQIN